MGELSMSNEKKIYTLVVKKQRIEVSKEVYKAYYRCRDREVYLDRVHKKNTISLEALKESGFSIELNSSLISKESAEEKAIKNILIGEIKEKLNLLKSDELFLVKEIFEKGVSEREIARNIGVSQQVVHYRKMLVLKKLKDLLNKK